MTIQSETTTKTLLRLALVLPTCLLALAAGGDAGAQFLPQPDHVRLKQMDYSNSSGEDGLSIYSYRRDGVMGAGLWMLRDHSRHSANFYVYNEAGQKIEKYREFSDDLTSTETFTYDAKGLCVEEAFTRSDGVAGTAKYQWGEDGRLLVADCRNYKGWLSARIDYRHEGGKLSGATISRDGQVIGDISYTYDPSGLLLREAWDFGGRWSQTFSYIYEPKPARVFEAASPLQIMNTRYRVIGEIYDYNGENGGPSEYSYDDDGRLEKKIFLRDDGLRTKTTYAFDDQGSLLSSHRLYHDGLTMDVAYTHDSALRLVGKSFRRSDGREGSEIYAYDRLGRLASAEYENMDFWLNGSLSFGYDDWGHIDSGTFAGRDGFDAELDFITDSYGNVLKVTWRFDSGRTQIYTFKYGPVAAGGSR